MRWVVLLLVLTVALLVGACVLVAAKAAREVEALQGEWAIEAIDKPILPPHVYLLVAGRFRIDGRRVELVMQFNNGERSKIAEGEFKVLAARSPKGFDLSIR